MALIEWNATFLVGVDELDRQHAHLLEGFNAVHVAVLMGEPDRDIRTTLGHLVAATEKHFAFEERLMEAVGFPNLAAHQRKHNALRVHLGPLGQPHAAFSPVLADRLLEYLRYGLLEHIMLADREFGVFVGSSDTLQALVAELTVQSPR